MKTAGVIEHESSALRETEEPFNLVIGYGNELRSDDGAGIRAAEIVESFRIPDVRVIAAHQLTPEMAEPIARSRFVLFLDALLSDGEARCRIVRLHEARETRPSGHACSPQDLLALARRLYGRSPQAWLIGIPTENFALGESLTPTAQVGVRLAAECVRDMIWIEEVTGTAERCTK